MICPARLQVAWLGQLVLSLTYFRSTVWGMWYELPCTNLHLMLVLLFYWNIARGLSVNDT